MPSVVEASLESRQVKVCPLRSCFAPVEMTPRYSCKRFILALSSVRIYQFYEQEQAVKMGKAAEISMAQIRQTKSSSMFEAEVALQG